MDPDLEIALARLPPQAPDQPSPAALPPRFRGDWRWPILPRGRNPALLLSSPRLGPRWTIDIDPSSTLT